MKHRWGFPAVIGAMVVSILLLSSASIVLSNPSDMGISGIPADPDPIDNLRVEKSPPSEPAVEGEREDDFIIDDTPEGSEHLRDPRVKHAQVQSYEILPDIVETLDHTFIRQMNLNLPPEKNIRMSRVLFGRLLERVRSILKTNRIEEAQIGIDLEATEQGTIKVIPVPLAISDLSPNQYARVIKLFRGAGYEFSEYPFDPQRAKRVRTIHAVVISVMQGALAGFAWHVNTKSLSTGQGVAFVAYNFGTAFVMTLCLPRILDWFKTTSMSDEELIARARIEPMSDAAQKPPRTFKSKLREFGGWYLVNYGINAVPRIITGPLGTAEGLVSAHPLDTLLNHGLSAIIGFGENGVWGPHAGIALTQIGMVSLFATVTGTLMGIRDTSLFEREANSNKTLPPNYSDILVSYGNLARSLVYSWTGVAMNVGLTGPLLFQIMMMNSDHPVFALHYLEAGVLVSNLMLYQFTKSYERTYYNAVAAFAEGSKHTYKKVRSAISTCGAALGRITMVSKKSPTPTEAEPLKEKS